MSSLFLLTHVHPLQTPCLRPAGPCAAEAFDDEPFSMNLTVDEAAAASVSAVDTDPARRVWACGIPA